jgi:hypothetical protein
VVIGFSLDAVAEEDVVGGGSEFDSGEESDCQKRVVRGGQAGDRVGVERVDVGFGVNLGSTSLAGSGPGRQSQNVR